MVVCGRGQNLSTTPRTTPSAEAAQGTVEGRPDGFVPQTCDDARPPLATQTGHDNTDGRDRDVRRPHPRHRTKQPDEEPRPATTPPDTRNRPAATKPDRRDPARTQPQPQAQTQAPGSGSASVQQADTGSRQLHPRSTDPRAQLRPDPYRRPSAQHRPTQPPTRAGPPEINPGQRGDRTGSCHSRATTRDHRSRPPTGHDNTDGRDRDVRRPHPRHRAKPPVRTETGHDAAGCPEPTGRHQARPPGPDTGPRQR